MKIKPELEIACKAEYCYNCQFLDSIETARGEYHDWCRLFDDLLKASGRYHAYRCNKCIKYTVKEKSRPTEC